MRSPQPRSRKGPGGRADRRACSPSPSSGAGDGLYLVGEVCARSGSAQRGSGGPPAAAARNRLPRARCVPTVSRLISASLTKTRSPPSGPAVVQEVVEAAEEAEDNALTRARSRPVGAAARWRARYQPEKAATGSRTAVERDSRRRSLQDMWRRRRSTTLRLKGQPASWRPAASRCRAAWRGHCGRRKVNHERRAPVQPAAAEQQGGTGQAAGLEDGDQAEPE